MAVFSRRAQPIKSLDGRTLQWLAGPVTGTIATSLLENLIEPGAGIPPHHHDVEELLVCLEGQGQVWADGEPSPFAAGDTAVIHAGVVHSVQNTGEGPFRMLAFFPTPEPLAYWQGGEATRLG